MERKKSNILSHRPESIIFIFLIGLVSVLLNFTFSHNSFAEYKATLSASVNEDTAVIDGTEIIESSDETAEHNINLKINTTNKTGYTATFSSKTEETALLNTNPAINTKINSISSNSALTNFPANTWGYRFDDNTVFSPIPAKSASVNLIKTTEKTTGAENHNIKLGMKLNSSLKPGNYENRLIVSIVSNPYTPKAVMTEGDDFNGILLSLLQNEPGEIKYFRKSLTAPALTINTENIEDEESDYEIKLWLDPTDKTAYYYAEPEKIYLNTDSSGMFFSGSFGHEIGNILELDLSNFDTSQVTDMGSMFANMSSLTTLNLSNFDTSKVTDMIGMFADMSNLTTLNLSNFDTSNVMRMVAMFENSFNLTTLNLSSFNTSGVTDMKSMFAGMSHLTTLDLSSFDTSNVLDMSSMFCDIRNLTTLDLSNFDTANVRDMSYMFKDTHNLTTLNLSSFDTSKVTNMESMFSSMSNLTTINLSNFDTSQVTDMGSMFANMSSLTTLNLSNFDTSKVTNMESMFSSMSNLTTLDISNFDTSKVTNMEAMFSSMSNLTTLNLSSFNTSGVTDMKSMFAGMSHLTTLDLSSFDTSQVRDMSYMFSGMANLVTLDLSNFDTSNVRDMSYMFYLSDERKLMDKLEKIYVNNDFDTTNLTYYFYMFVNRNRLRGGNGSFLANPSDAAKTWLRVDRPGVQGYFTRKP